jgi:hypothetical protein
MIAFSYIAVLYKLLEKMIDAYNKVYPGFSELLDYSFKEYIGSFKVNRSCDHEWYEVNIHKVGECLRCGKCLGLVEV